MDFEWDEQKNKANLRKHGIAFDDIPPIFSGEMPLLIDYDDRAEYGEERWLGIGLLGNYVIVIVFTEVIPGTIRLISARKANKDEQRRYYETLGK
ncbi:MAG: BrnT family toxin [Chloroflexi bacterium]|nr:BrnT family toxin [Chloroflexota bacterium]MCI0649185.1 BrnT family toxin [Chloroflexota bacterium]MCI0732092.1 BrnT family toxin [Chloroflexota bacterium]